MTFYFLTEIQTIMDESLGTNLHAPNKFIYTCSASPPPSYNVGHSVHAISPDNIVFGGVGGGGGKQRILKLITVFFEIRVKNTEN